MSQTLSFHQPIQTSAFIILVLVWQDTITLRFWDRINITRCCETYLLKVKLHLQPFTRGKKQSNHLFSWSKTEHPLAISNREIQTNSVGIRISKLVTKLLTETCTIVTLWNFRLSAGNLLEVRSLCSWKALHFGLPLHSGSYKVGRLGSIYLAGQL